MGGRSVSDGVRRSDAVNPRRPGALDGSPEAPPAHLGGRTPPPRREGYDPGAQQNRERYRDTTHPPRDAAFYQGADPAGRVDGYGTAGYQGASGYHGAPGYDPGAGHRVEDPSGGYQPGHASSAGFYDEETRYPPHAADPLSRGPEDLQRPYPTRSQPRSVDPDPHLNAVGPSPRRGNQRPLERPVGGRQLPSGGPPPGTEHPPNAGYGPKEPRAAGAAGMQDTATRVVQAQATSVGGSPRASTEFSEDVTGEWSYSGRSAVDDPGGGASGPGTRRPRDVAAQATGVAPPRTTRARPDAPGPTARRPAARAAGAPRTGRPERAMGPASDRTGESRTEREATRSRRRDEQTGPSAPAGDSGPRRPRPQELLGTAPLLRRVVYAVVILTVAFAVGGGAGFVWKKINSSGTGTAAAPSTGSSGTASSSISPQPSAAPSTSAAATVPADWVAVTDSQQKARFSHPPGWKLRRDNTAVFYVESSSSTGLPGPLMVGVARVVSTNQQTALNAVQASEFAGQQGLTRERSGEVRDSSGVTVYEYVGSYLREGQRVTYVMRTVPASGAVYVLISRSASASAETASTLINSLRASFRPA